MSKKVVKTDKNADIEQRVEELQAQLIAATERERRALADYQNLLRRTQEERAKTIAFASRQLVEDLLQPLEHLELAAQTVDDAGLKMVMEQLWVTLQQHGVEKIEVKIGDDFDMSTMEAVEKTDEVSDAAAKVVKVTKPGFKLNGSIIQHAKVVVGA